MEGKTERRLLGVFGIVAAALWMEFATMLSVPRAVHAQDGSAVSSSGADSADNSAVDEDDAFGAAAAVTNPDATVPALPGSWNGTADDRRLGGGTVDVNFSQLNKVVTASAWSVEYGASTSLGGTAVGKLNGRSLRMVMDDPTISRKCRIKFTGKVSVSDGIADEIKGKYTLKGCFKKNSKGTFDLFPTT
jgi:hypothetical protein